MSDPMPQWRSFSSSAPAAPQGEPTAAPTRTAGPRRPPSGWLVPVLAGLGGAAGGAALVALLLAVLAIPPEVDGSWFDSSLGESLGAPLVGGSSSGSALETTTVDRGEIVVDVAGAVTRPGLHRLRAGDRVGDAIEAAGGFAPRADLAATSQALNLAQPLQDGAKVLVPELGIDRAPAGADDARVDLNHAGQADLESLPGIGPVTARKIIEARDARPFTNVRDLRTRGLVGESVYGDLKDLVRVG